MTFCDTHPGQEPKAQRPAGMSREAFALLGDSHPIAPSELANELKKPGDAQVGQLLSDHVRIANLGSMPNANQAAHGICAVHHTVLLALYSMCDAAQA
jgi:hypothetical protein